MFKKYYMVSFLLLFSILKAEEDYTIFYSLDQGPNLLSFPILLDHNSIELFFSSENENLLSNYNINDNIISIISEGEFGITNNSEWFGSLETINGDQGYWIVAEEPITFLFIGNDLNQNLYFLHPGANLISYPFNTPQSSQNALNLFSTEMIYAIIGENEALLSINNSWWGSLNTFEPGRGYWFIVNDYTPFLYNQPIENFSNNSNIETYENDNNSTYNQSTLQSIFFIESIFISGTEIIDEIELYAYCNDIIVGEKMWDSNYSDIIVMGDDGFDHTNNYCQQNQQVIIKSNNTNQEYFFIKGENTWEANNYDINILSDSNFGDLNYNGLLNITDIIIILEHILSINEFNNNHQTLLANINQDDFINVADIIIGVENILDF